MHCQKLNKMPNFDYSSATTTRKSFKNSFDGSVDVGDIYLPHSETLYQMFSKANAKSIGDIDAPKATTAYGLTYGFYGEKIGDINLPKCTDFSWGLMYHDNTKTIGHIKTPVVENFENLFYKSVKLECIKSIDTRSQTDTTDMFEKTDSLTNPTATEQTDIMNGALYENSNPC